MWKVVKKIVKWLFFIILLPLVYLFISLILTLITIEGPKLDKNDQRTIYLSTNGVHLDIVLPIEEAQEELLNGLKREGKDRFLSFGWGDENFYVNTPTWGDLTLENAWTAMFTNSSTLMHVTRYQSRRNSWTSVKVDQAILKRLNNYLIDSFKTNTKGKKILLKGEGYTRTDNFYKATGSYSCFNTCNSWVNEGFQKSGLKSCLWTPFDFGLISKHE